MPSANASLELAFIISEFIRNYYGGINPKLRMINGLSKGRSISRLFEMTHKRDGW